MNQIEELVSQANEWITSSD